MNKSISESLEEILKEPFTYKDSAIHRGWNVFCRSALACRYVYMKTPFLIKLLAGAPLFYFSWMVYLSYFFFVIWSIVLNCKFRYNYSEKTFTIKQYFKVYFFKNVLFIMVAIFMYQYYFYKWGWLCFIYSLPMLLISIAYVLPIFDRRIYKWGW